MSRGGSCCGRRSTGRGGTSNGGRDSGDRSTPGGGISREARYLQDDDAVEVGHGRAGTNEVEPDCSGDESTRLNLSEQKTHNSETHHAPCRKLAWHERDRTQGGERPAGTSVVIWKLLRSRPSHLTHALNVSEGYALYRFLNDKHIRVLLGVSVIRHKVAHMCEVWVCSCHPALSTSGPPVGAPCKRDLETGRKKSLSNSAW